MPKLIWDQIGEKRYETGVEQVALYKQVEGAYPKGVAWNGITAFNLTPSGAEPTPLYANNTKYLTMMSVEELGGTIEAYTYPDEWSECDGSAEAAPGIYIGQQTRARFGLAAKTLIGNDTELTKYGYKLHLVYGGLASPTEHSHATVNDSPEAATLSWEFSTDPVNVTGFKPTSYICLNSVKIGAAGMAAIEAVLYGSEEAEPSLPLPDEVVRIISEATSGT